MSKPANAATAARQSRLVEAIQLQQQGRVDAAMQRFRAVLADNPNDAVALYSLSAMLMQTRGVDAAGEVLALVEHGVNVAPQFEPLWFARAMVLQTLGRRDDALASYDEALRLKPGYVDALLNSGALLREQHQHVKALERFNQVLAIDPNHESALGNCAILLTEFKQSEKAIAMFERLLKLNPDYPYGLGLLSYERLHACDWTDFEALRERIVSGVRAGRRASKTLGLMAISDQASDHFLAARIFARQWFPKQREALWNGERYEHDKIRIAYVSPDLREHPVGHLTAGLFERHDKSRFETIAISLGIDDQSRLRARMQQAFDRFVDVRGMGSRQIAELMREMEVDIAIDLAGYTSDSRIDVFAWRPAPLQIAWLGYPGTLATDYVDHILADPHVIPPEHEPFYTENVVRLPHTYLPTDTAIEIAAETPTREACGLPPTGPVLCSFSHDYKIHPDVFAAWMRILKRLPGSVLWLVTRNAYSQANLRRSAEAHGIDPARLVFAQRVPRVEDHLARYRLADVFLDTTPYNAHTTAADALMAGLPVVTCMGNAFPARVAGSLLHAIGLPELITHTLADYEQLVVELVSDRARLADVKTRLAANRQTHALFDTQRFCTDLEATLRRLHDERRQTLPGAVSKAEAVTAPTFAAPPAAEAELAQAAQMLAGGNMPQTELHLRRYLRFGGSDPRAAQMLTRVAAGYGLPEGHELVEHPAAAPGSADAKYLLVKAWGYGFWSDVHHVLGQMLLAELTGRIPVVHWGTNSLFGDGSGGNAWDLYFEPVSDVRIDDLAGLVAGRDIYPPKWRLDRLRDENVGKWSGPQARLAAPYFFARDEALAVSDFYATVSSIVPWIGRASRYHGLSDDRIYRQLFDRYLKPRPQVVARVDAFHRAHLAGRHWAAVHVRGSDKVHESAALHQTNERYDGFVERIVELNPEIGLFLLTDAVDVHARYAQRYGDRVVTTPALRSDSTTGVHMQGHAGSTVGTEVLVDALLAARCDYFVGNQESNVSLAIASLKDWPNGLLAMLGQQSARAENLFLHRAAAPA
ncbi:MAG: tetratricopeptide repeat protein [Proteobacteria bacterium]|nr:tetratricopeptide repeat protein [Pseudomonadota bacterium]